MVANFCVLKLYFLHFVVFTCFPKVSILYSVLDIMRVLFSFHDIMRALFISLTLWGSFFLFMTSWGLFLSAWHYESSFYLLDIMRVLFVTLWGLFSSWHYCTHKGPFLPIIFWCSEVGESEVKFNKKQALTENNLNQRFFSSKQLTVITGNPWNCSFPQLIFLTVYRKH